MSESDLLWYYYTIALDSFRFRGFMSAAGVYVCVRGGRGHLLLLLIWLYDVILSFRLHFRHANGNDRHKPKINSSGYGMFASISGGAGCQTYPLKSSCSHTPQISTLHDSASDAIFAVHIDHLARRNVVEADDIFKDCATKQMYCTCELRTMDFSPLRFDAAIQSYWR